ncbi:AhpD-like protein [Xylogone sp. PMI_703]|nr:AhpD-like protein [Xylogone sp. PMI_703]
MSTEEHETENARSVRGKLYPNQRAVFSYIDPKNTTPELAEAFKVLPFERNVLKLVAHAQGFFPGISHLLSTVFAPTRELATLEWQLVVLRTAALIGAHYVFEINTPVALVNGMPNAKRLLIAFGKTDDAEFFSTRDQLLAAFVEELIRTNTASDALVNKLKANFTEGEIMEVIVIVGLYTIFGRVANVSRIDEDPEIPGLKDSLTVLTGQKERAAQEKST